MPTRLRYLFCDVCFDKFKRPRRFIRPNSADEISMKVTGMCCQCFDEANPEMKEDQEKLDAKFTKFMR